MEKVKNPKILLLVSGNLGTKAFLYIKEQNLAEICGVMTDSNSLEIQELCKNFGVPLFIGNPRKLDTTKFINSLEVDLLLSINYLFIIGRDIINKPLFSAVNIHGSLLPKYRGRTPHVWAVINGENYTGVTAHHLTENLDAGDIIEQQKVRINKSDTGQSILTKFEPIYFSFIKSIISSYQKLSRKPQNNKNATYFSKRESTNGLINFEWNKVRIFNWIRAQARPYPGAFFLYENENIMVHKSKFVKKGFKDTDENGLILSVLEDGIVVKVCDGAILLYEIEDFKKIKFEELKVLNK